MLVCLVLVEDSEDESILRGQSGPLQSDACAVESEVTKGERIESHVNEREEIKVKLNSPTYSGVVMIVG